MESAPKVVRLLALLAIVIACALAVGDLRQGAARWREHQRDHVARMSMGYVEPANGGEAQGRGDVHAVKTASASARSA